jgi:hypothetical protein
MPSVASLERQIALLEKKVDRLIEMVSGLTPKKRERDPSIDGFCRRHGFTRRHYTNLRNRGEAPRETAAGSRRIITEEAEFEWIAAREADAVEIAVRRAATREANNGKRKAN